MGRLPQRLMTRGSDNLSALATTLSRHRRASDCVAEALGECPDELRALVAAFVKARRALGARRRAECVRFVAQAAMAGVTLRPHAVGKPFKWQLVSLVERKLMWASR